MFEKQATPESGHTVYTVLTESEQRALDYFANRTTLAKSYKNNLSAPQIGRWINGFVHINMKMVARPPKNDTSDSAVMMREFQDWVPMSAAEARTFAIEGVSTRLNRAVNTHQGIPERAA